MNCRDCRDLLTRCLDETPTAAEQAALDLHLGDCAGCRELQRILESSLPTPVMEAPEGFLSEVLAATVGERGCDAACRLLTSSWDGALSPEDSLLLGEHLEGCPACSLVEAVLRSLKPDLAAFQELDPGPVFTREILERTRTSPTSWRDLLRNVPEAWRRLLQRPRIAWEGALVGACLVLLFLGRPVSELARVSARSAALFPREIAEVVREDTQVLSDLGLETERLLPLPGIQAVEASKRKASDWSRRLDRTEPVRRDLRMHGKDLIRAVSRGDLAGGRSELDQVQTSIGVFWDTLRSGDATKPTSSEAGASESED